MYIKLVTMSSSNIEKNPERSDSTHFSILTSRRFVALRHSGPKMLTFRNNTRFIDINCMRAAD